MMYAYQQPIMYTYQQQHSTQLDHGDGDDIIRFGVGDEHDDDHNDDENGSDFIFNNGNDDNDNENVHIVDFEGEEDNSNEEEEITMDMTQPTAEDLRKLTVKDLKVALAARGLLQHGRKEDLIQRILHPQDDDFKRKPTVVQWKHSKAKAFLLKLLMDETSDIHNKSPEEVWGSSEWFQQYPKHRFVVNMENIKKALEARGRVVKEDIEIIQSELAALNLSTTTKRGYPHWHTHAAKNLLTEDVMLGRHVDLEPKIFHTTRKEYEEFPLGVFRKHIYQEERKQREKPLKVAKRNQLGLKKYQQEVEAEAVRWNEQHRAEQVGRR